MKFFCGTLAHETNRFSPVPTDLDSYREAYLYLPSTGEGAHWREQTLDDVSWRAIIDGLGHGHEIAFGPLASAQPSRPMGAAGYARLRSEFVQALECALPVDAVLLQLHGAQVADGTDDCAGDILAAVRSMVGREVPIGVVLDLHGNVSDAMVENADILLACLQYPHTDTPERASQLAGLVLRCARRELAPVMVYRRVPMLGTYFTTSSPMREFVTWAKEFEGRDGVLAVSVMHGFACADVVDCCGGVIVCADRDRAGAERIATKIAHRFFELREQIGVPRTSVQDALAQALAHHGRPVVIADTTDNPGGGAAGDSTWLLRALIEARVDDCALGMVWDPMAAQFAERAGVGSRLPMRIGGKSGAGSGLPLDCEAQILCCRRDICQTAQGMQSPLGPAALLAIDGVRVVVNSVRQQVFDPHCFEAFGVSPRECRIIVVKSHQHFHTTFAPWSSKIIYATPPGSANIDLATTPFRHLPRPVYPLDEPPFDAFGSTWPA